MRKQPAPPGKGGADRPRTKFITTEKSFSKLERRKGVDAGTGPENGKSLIGIVFVCRGIEVALMGILGPASLHP